MKLFISCLILVLLAGVAVGQTEKLTIEQNHSTIGFAVPIAGGITRVTGKFTESDLLFDYADSDLTKSKIVFIIKTRSVLTGIPDRDAHLRTADFFDADKYPDIVFTSSQITGAGTKFTMAGTLQLHGVTRQITLPVEVTGRMQNTIGFQILSSVNRKDFDIAPNYEHTTLSNFLPDVIEIEINLWTKRDKR